MKEEKVPRYEKLENITVHGPQIPPFKTEDEMFNELYHEIGNLKLALSTSCILLRALILEMQSPENNVGGLLKMVEQIEGKIR